jgi:hypothetical protein
VRLSLSRIRELRKPVFRVPSLIFFFFSGFSLELAFSFASRTTFHFLSLSRRFVVIAILPVNSLKTSPAAQNLDLAGDGPQAN